MSSLIILNILSLTGNALVCILIFKNKRRYLRTTTNLYIVALAVSDLLSAVLVMPFAAGVLIASKWPFGEVFCQFHAFFSLFVIYVSPVTMGLTAVNRYMRMCKSNQQYNRLFSPRKSRALLAVVWILVACYVAIPRLAGLQAYEFVPGYAQCSIAHLSVSGKITNYCIVITLFFLTPLMMTAISYTKVAKMIRKHNADATSKIQRRRENNVCISVQEIKLSKSLFAVVFAFMICWIPFWIIVVLRRFHLVATMPRNVELLCMFFLYLSNTINPFIYAGMNPVFREEFRKILFCEQRNTGSITSSREEAKTNGSETQSNIFHRNRAKKSTITTASEANSLQTSHEGEVDQLTLDTLGVDKKEGFFGVFK